MKTSTIVIMIVMISSIVIGVAAALASEEWIPEVESYQPSAKQPEDNVVVEWSKDVGDYMRVIKFVDYNSNTTCYISRFVFSTQGNGISCIKGV